jgi:uncharacterized protein (DUF697 family)
MAGLSSITNAWSMVSEIDLRPLREQAEAKLSITLVGKPGSGRHLLAEQMRRDPSRPENEYPSPLLILNPEDALSLPEADLVILLLNAADSDDHIERALVRNWLDAGKRVLVLINQQTAPTSASSEPSQAIIGVPVETWKSWGHRNVVVGDLQDEKFLLNEFVPAVMRLLPTYYLALGRYYPLFRQPVAHHLINDACFTNAAYSLSSGLVEIVPVLNIPMNVADVIILTKNQIFLAYKLGLALGMSTQIQSYISTFGGVLGAGFFWRQLAHMLVGVIPAWGIIPKMGVSYAGTYVVGNVVLRWYLTGKHISKAQMRQLYSQAFSRGKQVAANIVSRRKRVKSGGKRKAKKALPAPSVERACAQCGKSNAADASFCQYCGTPLVQEQEAPTGA